MIGIYESVPFAEQDSTARNVFVICPDLNVPDAVAVAPEKEDEPFEKLHNGDSSV